MTRQVCLLLLAPLCLSLPSCAGSGAEQAAGGAATASAVALAIPLSIPLIPVSLISNSIDSRKQAKEDQEYWNQHDPEARKRTAKIRARDPKADARRAAQSGTPAYFRGRKTIRAGLPEDPKFKGDQAFADTRTIARSPFLSGLEKQTGGGLVSEHFRNQSPAAKDLEEAGETYRAAFNQEMQRLRKGR